MLCISIEFVELCNTPSVSIKAAKIYRLWYKLTNYLVKRNLLRFSLGAGVLIVRER